jgi:hypothetical protein
MSTAPIEKILAERTPHWMAIPGVLGTAIGRHDEQLCLKVYVSELTDEVVRAIPESIDGYRIVIQETGPITAL